MLFKAHPYNSPSLSLLLKAHALSQLLSSYLSLSLSLSLKSHHSKANSFPCSKKET